jgi:hypothetical protein
MAHISGTFSDPKAGKLYVTLTGNFGAGGVFRDAGFSYSGSSSSSANLLVTVTVGGVTSAVIDRYCPIISMVLTYPGGDAVWNVTTQTAGSSLGGLTSVSMSNLVVTLNLVKK